MEAEKKVYGLEDLYEIQIQTQKRLNMIYSRQIVVMKKSLLERIKDLF